MYSALPKKTHWSDEVLTKQPISSLLLHSETTFCPVRRATVFLCPNCLTCCWKWGSSMEKFCLKDGTWPSGKSFMTGNVLLHSSPRRTSLPPPASCDANDLPRQRFAKRKFQLAFPPLDPQGQKGTRSSGTMTRTQIHTRTNRHTPWFVGNFLVLVLKFYNQPEGGSVLKQTSGPFSAPQNG